MEPYTQEAKKTASSIIELVKDDWAYFYRGKNLHEIAELIEKHTATLRAQLAERDAQLVAAMTALESVYDYWNGGYESALDAIQEVEHRAFEAVKAIKAMHQPAQDKAA